MVVVEVDVVVEADVFVVEYVVVVIQEDNQVLFNFRRLTL